MPVRLPQGLCTVFPASSPSSLLLFPQSLLEIVLSLGDFHRVPRLLSEHGAPFFPSSTSDWRTFSLVCVSVCLFSGLSCLLSRAALPHPRARAKEVGAPPSLLSPSYNPRLRHIRLVHSAPTIHIRPCAPSPPSPPAPQIPDVPRPCVPASIPDSA